MPAVPQPPTCPIPSYANVRSRVFLDVHSAEGAKSSWGVNTHEALLFECPESGLRFRQPAPASEIEAFYEAEYHDRMVGDAAEERTRAYQLENEERIRYLKGFVERGTVLDVGCSTGLFAQQLKSAGFDVYASDISTYACEKAANLLGREKVFCGALGTFADELQGRLDAITMMDVIEHFDDVVSPLKTLHGMLRPGGVLFLRTPTLSSPFYRVADFGHRISGGRFKQTLLKLYHAEHFFFFNEKNIKVLLEDTGYQVVDIAPDPLLWANFRTAEMRHGPLMDTALACIYFAGRALGRGHGMRVVARRVS
jgi:2-polyprenyl-3-methyl-5-hydroxy-6-metoxy-1,4-benzoquinol methylase